MKKLFSLGRNSYWQVGNQYRVKINYHVVSTTELHYTVYVWTNGWRELLHSAEEYTYADAEEEKIVIENKLIELTVMLLDGI